MTSFSPTLWPTPAYMFLPTFLQDLPPIKTHFLSVFFKTASLCQRPQLYTFCSRHKQHSTSVTLGRSFHHAPHLAGWSKKDLFSSPQHATVRVETSRVFIALTGVTNTKLQLQDLFWFKIAAWCYKLLNFVCCSQIYFLIEMWKLALKWKFCFSKIHFFI